MWLWRFCQIVKQLLKPPHTHFQQNWGGGRTITLQKLQETTGEVADKVRRIWTQGLSFHSFSSDTSGGRRGETEPRCASPERLQCVENTQKTQEILDRDKEGRVMQPGGGYDSRLFISSVAIQKNLFESEYPQMLSGSITEPPMFLFGE